MATCFLLIFFQVKSISFPRFLVCTRYKVEMLLIFRNTYYYAKLMSNKLNYMQNKIQNFNAQVIFNFI